MFPLLLQTIISNQMRLRRLQGLGQELHKGKWFQVRDSIRVRLMTAMKTQPLLLLNDQCVLQNDEIRHLNWPIAMSREWLQFRGTSDNSHRRSRARTRWRRIRQWHYANARRPRNAARPSLTCSSDLASASRLYSAANFTVIESCVSEQQLLQPKLPRRRYASVS